MQQRNSSQYVQDRYMESFLFLQTRKKRQVNQLVLLNNLQRGDQNISSTLLLTLFNRVLSSLYDDKIQVKFLPSQGILQEQLDSYNTLAQSDYIEMEKAKLDYDWAWDTLFFGRGYMETLRFDKDRKIMQPEVINPLVFGYDPYFENVQDWRYYWKWITKSKVQLQKLIKKGTITNIQSPDELSGGIDPYLWDYKLRRDAAKKAVEPSPNSKSDDVYQILEFYSYDENGDKQVQWYDRDMTLVIWEDTLTTDKNGECPWPIVVKEAFREPHSSVVFSVADLLDDKHRAKSVLLNLAFIAAKDKANPLYGYNPDKVRDVAQFFSRQINQHIPMDDATAAWPLNTQEPMSAGLLQFISILTQEANDPVGTGQTAQPQQKAGSDSATEAAIDQQMSDMAQSLQSKVMQFGESEFWSHWFHSYAVNANDLGDKMANIVGVKGITTKTVNLKDFVTDYPPGVMVYSATEAEYKELVLRRDLMQLYPQLQQTLDPDGMRNFNKYVFFPKFLQDPSLIDIMLPKTIDELKAEGENTQLAINKMPNVLPTDNHETHIYTHMMVQPKTWATWMHIEWHQELLAQQKQQQMQVQQQNQQNQQNQQQLPQQAQPSTLNPGKEKKSPMAQASPLKSEINNQTVVK